MDAKKAALVRSAWTAVLLLVAAAVFVVLRLRDAESWWWLWAGIPFGAALYLIYPRSRAFRDLPFLTPFFPGLDEVLAAAKRAFESRRILDRLSETLAWYGVPELPEEEREAMVRAYGGFDDDEARLASFATSISQRLADLHPHLTPPLLRLLYDEAHGGVAAPRWHQERRQLAAGLATALLTSGRLARLPGGLPLQPADLERLLGSLETFTVGTVRQAVAELDGRWQSAMRYFDFLERQGITTAAGFRRRTALRAVLARRQGAVGGEGAGELEILDACGRAALLLRHRELKAEPERADALRDVSLAVFLADTPALRERVCRRMARNETAVRVVLARCELTEDLLAEDRVGDDTEVRLADLIAQGEPKLEQKQEELGASLVHDLAGVRDLLAEGKWATRIARVLERTYRNVQAQSEKIDRLSALIESRPSLRDSLKRIFKSLRPETIERYLEARKTNAYILTFKSPRGALASLLDCFQDPVKRQRIRELGVTLEADGREKYNFRKYTSSARIGIVPLGWTFEQFYRNFQRDFALVVENRRSLVPASEHNWNLHDLKNIELIVNRLGLSGRTYYGFVSVETRRQAIERIRELLADLLTEQELQTLIAYESEGELDLGAAIMAGTLAELVRCDVVLAEDEARFLDRFDEALREAIVVATGCDNPQDLGRRLFAAGAERRRELVEAAVLIRDRLELPFPASLDLARWRQIVETYLEILRSAAGLDA